MPWPRPACTTSHPASTRRAAMTGDDGALIAAVPRLAAADRRACARVARLLGIGDIEARIVVGLAGGGRVTARSPRAEFGLSPGGAAALPGRPPPQPLRPRGAGPAGPRPGPPRVGG